ncbi:winged helix-turn-helix transcriptional regulator [Candidatus Bathyarchaeota archaeon]|nr:MAG: winged helix-turn-helix transcriptional regulator [Candidatus Bathyarchaeota archaeon]
MCIEPEILRTFKFVRDPNAFELMADDTRRRVIYLLRAKEMTVSQIASELQKTPQGIYHHIRKLLDAGLVEVAKEERVDHFIETYYRATAEVFEFIHGEGGSEKYGEQRTREALQALKQLGIDARADDEIIERLLKISKQMNELALTPEMEERIQSLEGLDFIGKKHVADYLNLLTMSDKQFEEWLNFERTRRNLLKSAVSGPIQVQVQNPKPK